MISNLQQLVTRFLSVVHSRLYENTVALDENYSLKVHCGALIKGYVTFLSISSSKIYFTFQSCLIKSCFNFSAVVNRFSILSSGFLAYSSLILCGKKSFVFNLVFNFLLDECTQAGVSLFSTKHACVR